MTANFYANENEVAAAEFDKASYMVFGESDDEDSEGF